MLGDRELRETESGLLVTAHLLDGWLLLIHVARGLGVDDKARQRILACTDLETLEQWLERAIHAATLSDVLGELTQ